MNCSFKSTEVNKYKCEVCGYEIISPTDKIFRECKSRGVGDTIARITEFLHIPQCGGCQQRQEVLNEMFPYGSNNGSG